jgi:hypothetical protein
VDDHFTLNPAIGHFTLFPVRIAESQIFSNDHLVLSIVFPLVGCSRDLHDDSPVPVAPLSEQPKWIGPSREVIKQAKSVTDRVTS